MAAPVVLEALPVDSLRQILAGLPVGIPGIEIAPGALPPPHVAQRALDHLARGCAPLWAQPFSMVSVAHNTVVGGCGFKGPPAGGCVEIGYGLSPLWLRQGFGARGVSLLLQLAAGSGQVSSVTAHIAPDNLASAALARRVGFAREGPLFDAEGELLVCWRRAV
jgi:[ribosomal protein S5]-alanine N-acetyltransferase